MTKLKINVTINVKQVDGQDAKFQEQTLSLRRAIVQALTTVYEGDQGNPVESRIYRTDLAHRVQTQDVVGLSIGDMLMLTPLIARTFVHPLVLATFIQAVEQAIPNPGPSVVLEQALNDTGDSSGSPTLQE